MWSSRLYTKDKITCWLSIKLQYKVLMNVTYVVVGKIIFETFSLKFLEPEYHSRDYMLLLVDSTSHKTFFLKK